MPRVSEAHRAARREQVLEAARRCFSENGFHATSMDDVIRLSGLSAGAVYQYFRSKDDLIVAAAAESLEAIRQTLVDIAEQPVVDPATAIARVLESWPFVTGEDGVDITRIALHGWSEATRNPELRDLVVSGYATFRTQVGELIARWRDHGMVRADLDPEATVPILLSLLLGYVVQRALLGPDVDVAVYEAGIAALLGPRP